MMLLSIFATSLLICTILIICAVFLHTIYRIVKNQQLNNYQKVLWMIVILVLNMLGCLIYLIVYDKSRHPKRKNHLE